MSNTGYKILGGFINTVIAGVIGSLVGLSEILWFICLIAFAVGFAHNEKKAIQHENMVLLNKRLKNE